MNFEKDNNYSKEYSDGSFWDKVKVYALDAGAEVIEKALSMYHALQDQDTPAWAKGVIIGALGYFISPIDAVPDFTPVVGYADDLGALALAFGTVAAHIKDSHLRKAKETMISWFGERR